MTESISGLFMETITIRELVGMMITDGKKLEFHPERLTNFMELLCDKDEICSECGGEGVCDYGFGEDVKTYPCENCCPEEDPSDEAYDRMKDDEAEAYFERMNDRD